MFAGFCYFAQKQRKAYQEKQRENKDLKEQLKQARKSLILYEGNLNESKYSEGGDNKIHEIQHQTNPQSILTPADSN